MRRTKPLEGIRVIDCSIWMFGTVASAHLADMGAEVIKVENPRGGDPGRGVESTGARPSGVQWNAYFGNNNRNKKSIAVDLYSDNGKEIVHRLIEHSDVFHSNMQRIPLERMGLTFEDVSKIKPSIIYSHASGFGARGPARDYPAHDTDGQARAGIMPYLGDPPVYTGAATGDAIGALTCAYAIATAIFHRERTGKGQRVDTSLFGSQVMFEALPLQAYLATGEQSLIRPERREDAHNPLYNLYRTKDKWILLGMIESEHYWPAFCLSIDRVDLAEDCRFDTHDKRGQNGRQLIAILDEILRTKTASEWLERWAKLGLVATAVNSLHDVENDPQAIENQHIVDFDHPRHGAVRLVGFPAQFSKTAGEIRIAEPELGEHTEEILTELLGFTWDDIGLFKDQGAIL